MGLLYSIFLFGHIIDSLVDISLSSESGGKETEGEVDEEPALRTTTFGSDSTFSQTSSCEAWIVLLFSTLSRDLLSTSVSCTSSSSDSGSFTIDSSVDTLSSESVGGAETEVEADDALMLITTGCGSDSIFSRTCEAFTAILVSVLSDNSLSTSVSYEPCASSGSSSDSFVVDSFLVISLC